MKKKKSSDYSHGDLVVKKAMEDVTGGLPREEIVNAVHDAVEGMQQLARRFKEGGHQEVKASEIPRAMSYLAKCVDEVIRLTSFLQGGPDSRISIEGAAAERSALDGMLQRLNKQQFETFSGWIKESKEREGSN